MSAGVLSTEAEALIHAGDLEGLTPVERAQVSGTAPGGGTYAEHFEVWLNDVKVNGGLAPRTWIEYEGHLRNLVLPLIGGRPVASLSQRVIRDMFAAMTRNGVTPHTKFQTKCALGRSLRELVPSVLPANPTHGIKIARPPATQLAVLISTGARYGEGPELRVKDIDFRTGEGWIRRRVSVVNGALDDGCRYVILHGTKAGVEHSRSIGLPSAAVQRAAEGASVVEADD